MFYQMQEGYLTLSEGDWQDRSVHMLAARHMPVSGTNIVVTREELPSGFGLSDYVDNQKRLLAKELTSFKLMVDRVDSINEMPGHYLEFTWDNRGNAMHQIIICVDHRTSLLNFTATVPGAMDDAMRAELLAVLKSYKTGPAPVAKEGAGK